jgi:sirohydrochlorin ferrochelatase
MWPMLFDLLPHFARLLPMADKFLATRSASEKAQEAALAAMSATLGGNLGQVTEMHAGIQRALKEQAAQVSEISVEVTRMRMGVESTEARVAKLEKTSDRTMRLLVVALTLLSMVLALVAILLLQISRR